MLSTAGNHHSQHQTQQDQQQSLHNQQHHALGHTHQQHLQQQQQHHHQQHQLHGSSVRGDDLNFATFAELCRLCAINNGPAKIHLFEKEAEQRNFLFKLRTLMPNNISKDDFLPKNICERCIIQVEHMYEWRQSSLRTETILRSYADSMRAVTATINFQVVD